MDSSSQNMDCATSIHISVWCVSCILEKFYMASAQTEKARSSGLARKIRVS